MSLPRLYHPDNKRFGFTIVELLIVIVVIAILATISVVAYSGIQDRAIDAAVRSDLSNFSKKIELARINSADTLYPLNPTAAMEISATKDAYNVGLTNWWYCRIPDRTEYLLAVRSKKGQNYFLRMNGTVETNGNLDGSTTYSKLGSVAGAGCTYGHTWNSTTSTGTWASWVH